MTDENQEVHQQVLYPSKAAAKLRAELSGKGKLHICFWSKPVKGEQLTSGCTTENQTNVGTNTLNRDLKLKDILALRVVKFPLIKKAAVTMQRYGTSSSSVALLYILL